MRAAFSAGGLAFDKKGLWGGAQSLPPDRRKNAGSMYQSFAAVCAARAARDFAVRTGK